MNEGNVVADFDSDLYGGVVKCGYVKVVAFHGKQVQGIDMQLAAATLSEISGTLSWKATLTFNGIGLYYRYAKGADSAGKPGSHVVWPSNDHANPILWLMRMMMAGHALLSARIQKICIIHESALIRQRQSAWSYVFLRLSDCENPAKEVQMKWLKHRYYLRKDKKLPLIRCSR